MAKMKDHTAPAVSPDQVAKEIENFLSGKETLIAQSIDQLFRSKKEIDRKVEEEKHNIDVKIEKLNELYHKATNRYYVSTKKVDGSATTGRQRRSKDELRTDALAIFELIQSKGKEGASGGEIRERFPKVGPSVVGFVTKNGGGKIRTEGHKASTRYFVA
jgi:hypothetical protein